VSFGDFGNGLFELIGGFCVWQNVKRIRQDKQVKGVDWRVTGFFTSWGFWNLWYYPSLSQWLSFLGGLVIVAGNVVWLAMAIKYRNAK
jgi:hypothetical protein